MDANTANLIQSLQYQIERLNSNIDDLRRRIDRLEQYNANTNTEIANLKQKIKKELEYEPFVIENINDFM